MALHISPDSLGAPETSRALQEREGTHVSKGVRVKNESRFTDRAQRCHKKVKGVDNVYAVCNASIIGKRGKSGAYRPGHYKA